MNTYISHLDYQRSPTGNDTSALIGNAMLLGTARAAGVSTLPLVNPTTATLNVNDPVYIFDGASSEIVSVSAQASPGATSISIQSPGLQYTHSQYTAMCSDGSQGSLAQCIIDASAAVESYCRQPLWQASYSGETLPLRTTRAAITRDSRVLIRPRRAPVQSVSAVALQIDAQTTFTLDPTQAQIDSDGWLVSIAQINPVGSSQAYYTRTPIAPTTPGMLVISYVAGFASLPYDVRRAAILLTSDLLSDRRNPTGAAELQQGKLHLVTRLRGDTSGDSVLTMRAHKYLDPYRQKAA